MEARTGHSEGCVFILRCVVWVPAALPSNLLGPSVSPGSDTGRARQRRRPVLGRLSRPAAPPRAWRQKATSQTAPGSAGKSSTRALFACQARSGRHPGHVGAARRPETHLSPDHSSIAALPPSATISHHPAFTKFSLGAKSLYVPNTHSDPWCTCYVLPSPLQREQRTSAYQRTAIRKYRKMSF